MEAALDFVGANESAYYCCLSPEGLKYYRQVNQVINGTGPKYEGSIPDFVKEHPQLEKQFQNEAKHCTSCGKNCATILPFCNGCNADLSNAPIQHGENVCMAFVYGLERSSKFPLPLSLRLETPEVLVYDDLLSRGSLHFNAIPTTCHLPDWRHLLRNPEKGLTLVKCLEEACFSAMKDQFWENKEWREHTYKEGAFKDVEALRKQMYSGINSVPSQFQIHLQYIAPGILPIDYHSFLVGKRFVKGRWLPYDYVVDALEAMCKAKKSLEGAASMTMEDIFASVEAAGGPNYDKAHAEAMRNYNRTHRACANWRQSNFVGVAYVRHPNLRPELLGAACDSQIEDESVDTELRWAGGRVDRSEKILDSTYKLDKVHLQSYGRPYDLATDPQARSYYAHAKSPGEVQSPDEWASS